MHAYIYAVKNVQKLWMNSQAWRTSEYSQTRTHTQAYTERCDLPGKAVKCCYLRKHLAKQTEPHKAIACSAARTPDQSSSHLGERRGEEAKERREGRASDQTRRDRGREKHAEGARNEAREEENNVRGGLRMRVLRENGGREERWKTERQLGKYWAGGKVKVKRDENGELMTG